MWAAMMADPKVEYLVEQTVASRAEQTAAQRAASLVGHWAVLLALPTVEQMVVCSVGLKVVQ